MTAENKQPGIFSAGLLPWLKPVWKQLDAQIKADHLPHAILLNGRPHSGIEQLTEKLATRLICTDFKDDMACGQCRNCRLYTGGGHPDVFSLQPEEDSKVIKVDQIRQFVHKISLTPGIARCKVALVRPAEAMNIAAANALLKTLEEPAGDTFIILSSTEPARLLATIRSRCQKFTINAASHADALAWLEGEDIPKDKAEQALLASRDLPLLAKHYLDDGLLEVRREIGIGFFKTARGQLDPVAVAESWAAYSQPLIWLWLSQWLADLSRAKLSDSQCIDPVSEAVRKIRPQLSAKKTLEFQNRAMQGGRSREGSLRQDLLFEQWLLNWVNLTT